MIIQLSAHTFIRHYGDISLVQNQRNDAKYFLQDAEPFLRFITREPQTEEAIVAKIAGLYECSPEEIAPDFPDFIQSIRDAVLIGENIDALAEQEEKFQYYSKAEAEAEIEKSILLGTAGETQNTNNDVNTLINDCIQKNHILSSLHIDLTISCTERCVHCYIPDYPNRFLPFETVCRILDEYRAMGGLKITFSGGEPMLHPQFCEILRHARKCDLMIYILSNLTLMNDEIAQTMAEVNIHYLQASVYSMIPEVHEAITRRPGSFRETMHGIDLMRKYNIPMKINTPVMKENFNSWQSVKDFCAEQNYKFISNASLSGRTNHDNSNLDHALDAVQMSHYLKNCQECDNWGKLPIPDAESPICSILAGNLNIDSQGNYYPCDGCHGLVLGNCNEMNMEQVWHSTKANELRSLKQKDFAECFSCPDREFCKVCPTNNFNETGDIFKHIPNRCMLAKLKRKIYEESLC